MLDSKSTFIDSTDSGLHYVANGSLEFPNNGYLRAWTRVENFRPEDDGGFSWRSSKSYIEFDCKESRYKVLAADLYPFNNLQGSAETRDIQEPKWTYPRPRTIGGKVVDLVCEAGKAALEEAIKERKRSESLSVNEPRS